MKVHFSLKEAGGLRIKGAFSLIFQFLLVASLQAQTWYVSPSGNDANDGTSWELAFRNLQTALDVAAAGESVWVAAGTYLPTESPDGVDPDPRIRAFHWDRDILVYGGFSGVETDLDQRDPLASPTILSGDFDGDDVYLVDPENPDFPVQNWEENAYHVLITANLTSLSRLDGFIIEGGSADLGGGPNARGSYVVVYAGQEFYSIYGGGMSNLNASPTISNCWFRHNQAHQGGAVYNENNSSPVISHCDFRFNLATEGGAVYSYLSTLTADHCVFQSNKGHSGGALYFENESKPTLSNCFFLENQATYVGGALYGIFSSLTLVNGVFWRNQAVGSGGGIYSNYDKTTRLTNCTFLENQAGNSGGAILSNLGNSTTILNCLFWGNLRGEADEVVGADIETPTGAPAVSYCLTQKNSTFSSGVGILNNQDPLLADVNDPDGPDDQLFTPDDGLMLLEGSPCIDMGLVSGAPMLDILGEERSGAPDLGAYEFYLEPSSVLVAAEADASWTAYPNPTTGPLTVRFFLPAPATVRLRILAPDGRIYNTHVQAYPGGWQHHTFLLDRPGLYVVEWTDGLERSTAKVVVK